MSDSEASGTDPRPLEDVFLEHGAGLAGAVRGILGPRADTGEVLQQAFLKAWKAERERGPANDRVAWLFVLTMNQARDVRRGAMRRERALPVEEVDERYSSVEAEAILKTRRAEGIGGRISREMIDSAAATLIAERWLKNEH